MGVWGTGIYANDTAADLKVLFQDLVRLPISTDELIQILTTSFPQAEDEGGDCHFALADLFHTYGIEAPTVRNKALELISSGKDQENKRELGMTEPDLRRRAAVLKAFAEKLAHPNPKPRNRKMLAGPEEWLFEEGDYAVFPTCNGEAINPYMPKRLMKDWVQDGWGGFAVLGRTRLLDFFAVYLIAILPSPETTPMAGFVELVTLSPQHFQKMQIKIAGHSPLIDGAVETVFYPGHPAFKWRPQILVNALSSVGGPDWDGYDNRINLCNFLTTAIPSPSNTQ